MLATIDTSTYADAARLLTLANQDAGAVAEALFDAIADAALSTGTTAGAATWADSYTALAQSVTAGISGLISALGNAALLLDASGHNHARAEAAAAPYGLPSYALPQRALCAVTMTGLPPIFGGDRDQPSGWSLITGYLSGHPWPGADLGRLGALAAAWRRAAEALQTVASLPTSAGEVLSALHSPELPAAIAVCTRLASIAGTLAHDCATLGDAVSRFADEVQHQRDPITEAVKDLVKTLALCEIGGAVTGAVTGSLGEWGANAYLATRIPRYLARIIELLIGLDETLPALRPALATTTATDRIWLTTVADTRPVIADITTSNHVLQNELDAATAATNGASAAGSRGEMTKISVEQLEGWERSSSSHTLSRHVGRSNEQLFERIVDEGIEHASTFPNTESAAAAISDAIAANERKLYNWLGTAKSNTKVVATFDHAVGTVVNSNGTLVEGRTVTVIIRRDATDPLGFRVHTAYVTP